MGDRPQIEFRTPHPGEATEFFRPVLEGFGLEVTPETIAHERVLWEPERSFGALDGDRWVASSGAYSLEATLPGCNTVAVSGITMVGVAPTHRRRGILREMMRLLLDDAVKRGESMAILTASETDIYGRFGFGVAARFETQEIDASAAAFREPLVECGRFLSLPPGEALELADAAWNRCRFVRIGELSRRRARWEDYLADAERSREGMSALRVVIHEGPDGPDGIVAYRSVGSWGPETHRLPSARVDVDVLIGATPEVEAALWQFVTQVDLIKTVRFVTRPIDDPIRWRLADPRQLTVISVGDWYWVRPLDVAAMLGARSYRTSGELVVELVDDERPSVGGRFRLTAGTDGAACVRAPEATADLTLGPTELGALSFGGVAPSVLAAAARIDEHTPGALTRADLLFPIDPAPFSSTMF